MWTNKTAYIALISIVFYGFNQQASARDFSCPGKLVAKDDKDAKFTLLVNINKDEKTGNIYIKNLDMLRETYMQLDGTDMTVHKTSNGYNLTSNKNFETKYGFPRNLLPGGSKFSVNVNVDENTNRAEMILGRDAKFTGMCK